MGCGPLRPRLVFPMCRILATGLGGETILITLARRYSGENTIQFDKLLQRDGRNGRMRKVASCRDFSWCLNAPAAVSP